MLETLIFIAAFPASYLGVAAFRRWSKLAALMDVPNDRSSHDSPTPRGAGLVIVLISLLLYALLTLLFTNKFSSGYFIGAVLVAGVSWLDDLYSVSFVWRFLVHAAAAAALIAGLGFWRSMSVPGTDTTFLLGGAGLVITFLWTVWMINAYNFMDGIDGLAGVQAILAGLGWMACGVLFGYQTPYVYGGVLVFASLGFLLHNWRPAKVFMGDVGSAFLGFTFAAMPLLAAAENVEPEPNLPFIAVLLIWFFLFDTIITFLRRAVRGQKVWIAHREHLYQRLIIASWPHSSVSLLYGLLTFLVIAAALVGEAFGGRWEVLPVSVVLILSLMLVILTARKKPLT